MSNTTDLRHWRKTLAPYQQPSLKRSILEIFLTVIPLFAIWGAAWFAVSQGYWPIALALCLPAGFFLVRLFIIQHDCGHRSYFRNRWANDWTGRILGVLTMTPHGYWRRSHAAHHATSGNLDRRGLGAVDTLTVEEYRALSPLKRFGYRLYRHPVVMFGVGPTFMFVLQNRIPYGMFKDGWRVWADSISHNIMLVAFMAGLFMVGGWQLALLIFVPTVILAASIGVWLFYVQHQFEDTYWERQAEWDLGAAALTGSSHLVLPGPLPWLTGYIGIHHVHHLSARIPFYRLPKVIKDHPALEDMSRMKLSETLKCTGLALWDEASKSLITFRQARRMANAPRIAKAA